jgi:N-acetylmuramoyl-L-alanine amidase
MKFTAVLITAILSSSCPLTLAGTPPVQNSSLIQKARAAFETAERLEAELTETPESERTRNAYIKVIDAYQRVYLITPHTGYADNALMTMARLYEEIKEKAAAIKTLNFLLREYPGTPFKDSAERDLARLADVPLQKSVGVDNIRYFEAPNSVRVIVDVSGDVKFVQGEAKDPERVFVDVSPARLNSFLVGKQWTVKSGLLEQIRVGQYDASTVRVVLDVGAIGRVTSFWLREPDRLVIDVLGKDVVAFPETSSAVAPIPVTNNVSVTPPVVTPPVPAPPPDAVKPVKVAADTEAKVITPARETNAGTRSLVRSLGLKLTRVVIDAGHGGHDTGGIGPSGYTEKELVLDVAARLKQLIEKALDAEVVMTRTDDSFVPLETRTALANQHQADLFISLHANSSRVRSVRGVETFYLNFSSSRENVEIATRENAASERSIHELQDLVKKIMLQDKVDESRELAQHIQRSLAARRGAGSDRGVKQAPFIVLIGANMPSILAEIAFISNPQEERLIKSNETRQAIAESLFEGVRSYAESLSGTKTAKSQEKSQQ